MEVEGLAFAVHHGRGEEISPVETIEAECRRTVRAEVVEDFRVGLGKAPQVERDDVPRCDRDGRKGGALALWLTGAPE